MAAADPAPRPGPPLLPAGWQQMVLHPGLVDDATALHVLARRHPRAGYRSCWSRLCRAGFTTSRKRVQRLLRALGVHPVPPAATPEGSGPPVQIDRPNQLWQTDLTAVWCGEDGWSYFTAVIDYICRSILGWTFTRRRRAADVIPAMETAWSAAFPGGGLDEDYCQGARVLRHDNGTQFTSAAYRDAAAALQLAPYRTAFRHQDGNAYIERLYLTLKTDCFWITKFNDYKETLAAIQAWVLDYNDHRPHQALGYATPAEARARP